VKLGTASVALIITLLTTPLRAEEVNIGPLDPGAGMVTAAIFPPASGCDGERDIALSFVPFTVLPRFSPLQWLQVPATARLTPDKPSIDATIPVGQMASGTYTGAVFYRGCASEVIASFIRIEVAAPATVDASGTSAPATVKRADGPGYCRLESGGLSCDGVPGYALACAPAQPASRACSLQGTGLAAPCSWGEAGWACTKAPVAVAHCAGGACKLEPAESACVPEAAGARCTVLPAFALECNASGSCALSDPRAHTGDAAKAGSLYAATQSADCERAGSGEFRMLDALGASISPAGGDLVTHVQAAFVNATTAPAKDRYLFQFYSSRPDAPSATWPGDGSRSADVGSELLPQRGVIEVTADTTGVFGHGGFDYQLQGGKFASVNVFGELNGTATAVNPLVYRRMSIDGKPYSSLMFEEHRRERVSDTLRSAGLANEPDPCRTVSVPTDPNYRRTGRNGGNSWGGKVDDQWAIKRVGFTDDENSAWRLVSDNAAPVVVAVIDTGLDWHHADLDPASLWRNEDEIADNGVDDDKNGYVDDVIGWNFVAGDNRPWDRDGHGTFVTGILVARHNDIGMAGVSPNARIMVLKGANDFGTSRASWLAEAVVYAVDNGARIINLSLGGPHESRMEQAAIEYARQKGVLIVAAAGNSGAEIKDFGPGGNDGVLTVGATQTDDRAADFSNFGEKLDLVAPGVDVLSLRARGTDVNYRPWLNDRYQPGANVVGDDKRYLRASGTSFSTPIVSATAALLLGNNPKLTGAQLASMLMQTATDIDRPGRDPRSGIGMIDPRAALAVAPEFRIVAKITKVDLAPAAAPTAAQVWGTVEATHFKRAWVQMGPGENPDAWLFVGQKRKLPIRDGQLASIPLITFTRNGPWTIVVNVEDKNGVVRRDRILVRIP